MILELTRCPTDPFTLLEPRHQDTGEFYKFTNGVRHILTLQNCQCPTDFFTISEPHNQEIGGFYEVQERRATDFEAPKLLQKVRSGS